MTAIYKPTDYFETLANVEDGADADAFLETLDKVEASYREQNMQAAIAKDLLRMAKTLRTLDAEVETLVAHQVETQRRIDTRKKRIDSLKTWMFNVYVEAGFTEKLKDEFVTVWTQANPPSCEVVDEALVPGSFKRVTVALPWAQAQELLPDEVLAGASVMVQRQQILEEAKVTGEVPPGIVLHTGNKSLRVR